MPTERIREEIGQSGVISFARFMELALYCPETGYYEKKKDNVGRQGDFITSVSVGSLFGELLAFQFAKWLDELKTGRETLKIIEAGAHDGKLAADILNWLQTNRPDLFSAMEYIILEPSPTRRQWQQENPDLVPFPNVRWYPSLAACRPTLEGILFSNELLDAFPVHRWGWDAPGKQWFEWGVALEGENFRWSRIPHPASRLPRSILDLPSPLLAVLPDNYTIETSPAAETWWREAAGALAHGKLLAIDYGFTDDEMFSPARTKGTLRAYHRHHVTDDLLANPGDQDLTAHVNFSAIQRAGEAAGLRTETFCTQPQFLTRILARAVPEKIFASMDARQVRQFQTLTHPEHLGRAFRVLVQSR
ncbi:MAG TPA: SAM-dependent methyltransferase [Candidatus Acidoferrales bacterium]|nr:SAM-dependent methyltransferase [Candidatus Acidoferrales bacterium]